MLARKPYIKPCIFAIEATTSNTMLAASEGGQIDVGYAKPHYYFDDEDESNIDNGQINNSQIPNDWDSL